MDGVHDMGGMHGFGAVAVPGSGEPYHERWEPRIFAIHLLISTERLGAGPGGRPTREEMEPAAYLEASYYERWLWSAEQRLLRAGTITPGEVDAMAARLDGGAPEPERRDPTLAERTLAALAEVERIDPVSGARFSVGDRVRVRRMHPAGHTRAPRYVRGVAGTVEAVRGNDVLPDVAVYGGDAPVEPVYSVAFRSEDLWGPGDEAPFTVLLDLWQSYLAPA